MLFRSRQSAGSGAALRNSGGGRLPEGGDRNNAGGSLAEAGYADGPCAARVVVEDPGGMGDSLGLIIFVTSRK